MTSTDQYVNLDGGATYRVREQADGTLALTGMRTMTTYTSAANALQITGKARRQDARSGWGARCVLTLDTGEGVVQYRGVLVGA